MGLPLRKAPPHAGDGDAAVVKAAHEVHRPVDGVDDENKVRVQIVVPVVLLAEEARPGHGGGKALDQQGLDPAVVLGHHVAAAALALGQNAMRLKDQRGGLAFGAADQVKDLPIGHVPSSPNKRLYHSFLRLSTPGRSAGNKFRKSLAPLLDITSERR